MIIELLGFLFVFAIPGLLLTMIFFEKEPMLEKIALVVTISIGFTVLLGVFLGFNEFTYRLTGGLDNVWVYSLVINGALFGFYLYKNRKKPRKK